ncbi:TolC family protein, partial [bacterium]
MTGLQQLLMALFAPAVQGGPLTIDDAVALGERQAFAIAIQRTRVENTRQGVGAARAGLLPRATAGAVYTRFDQAITSSLGAGQPSFQVSPLEQRTASLGAQLPIDISGALRGTIGVAENQYRASRYTLQAAFNDIRLNIRTAFYNVLRTQASVDVQQRNVELAEAQLRQSRQLFDQQQVARVDVTRFEAQLAQAQFDLAAANNQLGLARTSLNLLLNRPIETEFTAADPGNLPTPPASADQTVTTALTLRPELKAIDAQRQGLRQQRRVTEAGDDPTLSVGVNYGRNFDAAGFGNRENQTTANVTVSWPFFDGGATRYRVRQVRQDEEQARIQMEQQKLTISQEVRNALINLTTARQRLDNAERQVTLAEEVYRLAGIRRDAGEGTYVEVVDAQNQLVQARNGVVNARYDYLTAYSQLQRAVGQDDLAAQTALK